MAEHEILAVERFPAIVFRSTGIAAEPGGRFHVRGMLTIRNVAKPVDIDVSLLQELGKIVWAEGRALVKLTDYGLKPPSTALGTIGTKDEMTVMFRMKLNVPESRGKDESPRTAFAVPICRARLPGSWKRAE
ncbi:MAG: YceI family protein [Acidobacteriota bacterium]|nr:YceI family protein [Acidobacteriota bacterium]